MNLVLQSKLQHICVITHHPQTEHKTQSYTNNKGHITHNECNTKKKVKQSL
jgi:hypothetical protein